MNASRIRTRWAAIGAAVAVSLGAGGIGIGEATTTSGERPIYLPIEPCRLTDTRAEFQVGPRSTPLGADETYDVVGWESVGNCTLPTDTAGLALNVTAVGPTAPTFLTIYPADAARPLTSNLNPTPGQPPTPNAVNVDLDDSGRFSVYNLAGNVHVVIDVVGIYDDHNHDDRYYTEAEIDAALGNKANSADVAMGFADSRSEFIEFGAANTPQTVGTLALPAGSFIVNATLVVNNNEASTKTVNCELLLGAEVIDETSADTTGIPLGANTLVGSREAVGLTGGGNLAAPDDAAVVCETTASAASGNYTGFSITAIKVSSVTRP